MIYDERFAKYLILKIAAVLLSFLRSESGIFSQKRYVEI